MEKYHIHEFISAVQGITFPDFELDSALTQQHLGIKDLRVPVTTKGTQHLLDCIKAFEMKTW